MKLHLEDKFTFRVIIAIVFAIYLTFGISRALTNMPWCDEAWFADSAVNLVRNGFMGNTLMVDAGGPLESIKSHTYWQPPLYFLAEALVFRIFGVGLFQARFLSVFFGLLGLLAIYYIVKKSLGNVGLPVLLALLLIATDYFYLNIASDARMDMMSASLTLFAIASYLLLRENRLDIGLLISNSLVCLSGLSHPNGILGLFMLWAIILYLDRKKLQRKHILLCVIPYAVSAVGWGMYIAKDIQAFKSQFFSNVFRPESETYVNGLKWASIRQEIVQRYLYSFGLYPGRTSIVPLFKLPVLLFFLVNFVLGPFYLKRKEEMAQWFVLLACFLGLMFVIANKSASYLVWITPLFVINSIAVWQCLKNRRYLKWVYNLALAYVVLISISGQLRIISMDQYGNKYLHDIVEFDTNYYQGGLIYGSGELAFYYDFDHSVIKDDRKLGWVTGRKAKYLALSPVVSQALDGLKQQSEDAAKYIRNLFDGEYELLYQGRYYTFCKLPRPYGRGF